MGAEGRPFSGAVVADDGYDLVHARFATPIALAAGLAAAAREVANAARSVQAIAGFELRIPEPLSHAEFDSFNRDYVAQLKGMGLEVNGMMPASTDECGGHSRRSVGTERVRGFVHRAHSPQRSSIRAFWRTRREIG